MLIKSNLRNDTVPVSEEPAHGQTASGFKPRDWKMEAN